MRSWARVPLQPLRHQLRERGKQILNPKTLCSRAEASHLCSKEAAVIDSNPNAHFNHLKLRCSGNDKNVFCFLTRCSTSSKFWTTESLYPHPKQKTWTPSSVFIHLFVQCFNLTEIQDQQEHCTPGYYYMLEHRVLHFRQHLTPFYGVLHCFYKV